MHQAGIDDVGLSLMCIKLRKKIFAFLKLRPGSSIAEIAVECGDKGRVAKDVEKLLHDGVIKREKLGHNSIWSIIPGEFVHENKKSEGKVNGWRYGRMCEYHRGRGVHQSCMRCVDASDRAAAINVRHELRMRQMLVRLFPRIMA